MSRKSVFSMTDVFFYFAQPTFFFDLLFIRLFHSLIQLPFFKFSLFWSEDAMIYIKGSHRKSFKE